MTGCFLTELNKKNYNSFRNQNRRKEKKMLCTTANVGPFIQSPSGLHSIIQDVIFGHASLAL